MAEQKTSQKIWEIVLGEYLSRKINGLNVAEFCRTHNIKRVTLDKWSSGERGARNPSFKSIMKLADALGMDMKSLLGDDNYDEFIRFVADKDTDPELASLWRELMDKADGRAREKLKNEIKYLLNK